MALTCGLYLAAMAAQGFWACTVLYALNAFFNTVYNMFLYPSIMRATPAAYQGRVIALFAALSNGGIALSMVAYGALADAWGAGAVCLRGDPLESGVESGPVPGAHVEFADDDR